MFLLCSLTSIGIPFKINENNANRNNLIKKNLNIKKNNFMILQNSIGFVSDTQGNISIRFMYDAVDDAVVSFYIGGTDASSPTEIRIFNEYINYGPFRLPRGKNKSWCSSSSLSSSSSSSPQLQNEKCSFTIDKSIMNKLITHSKSVETPPFRHFFIQFI